MKLSILGSQRIPARYGVLKPFNREVRGEIGFPFQKDPDELSRLIDELSENKGYIRAKAERARVIIRERYSWESVITAYESLLTNY